MLLSFQLNAKITLKYVTEATQVKTKENNNYNKKRVIC